MRQKLEQSFAWQGVAYAAFVLVCLLWPQRLVAMASTDELRTVTTLATLPLGVLHNDNSYTPVASFRGATYFVWIHSDDRPKVGEWRNGVLSSAYLSPNPAYTIRNDGHHYFSLGIDDAGYLHVTGDMHNYPATDMSYYPAEYQNKRIMYWVSTTPESLSMEFVGGDTARCMPGYGFSYHSFQNDQDRRLYFQSRIKVHSGGHKPGEMGLGLYRYNSATRTWTALGGMAPSTPASTYRSIAWENNGDVDAGGWYQGFRAAHRFDFDNRLHFAASIWNDSTKPDPTDVLYGRSDDGGATFKRGDGSAVAPPLRVEAGASQGDLVAGPGAYDLYASVAFNKAGDPLAGYTVNGSPQRFHYRTRTAGGAWSAQVADPFNTYIRAKYQTDANGVLTLLSPAGQYRRLNDFSSAGYNGAVGLNNNFVCVDELGLRENNEFIAFSKGSGVVNLVRLRFEPNYAALPAPWTVASLGTVTNALAGRFNGVDSLGGVSAGLGAIADNGRYAWQGASGDADLRVRVLSQSWSADGAQAGLLIRQSGAVGAKMAGTVITYRQGAKLIGRAADGAGAVTVSKAGHTASEWLRLVKSGGTVSAYRSDNGLAWELIGTQALALTGSFQAGIFQASGGTATGIARFDNFSLSTTVPSATATPTVTRSRTATPSSTRTSTLLPSITPSVTVTRSSTASATATRTLTPSSSATQTRSVSASVTATLTPSTTPSQTPSSSSSATVDASATATPSSTAISSASVTATRTSTQSATLSVTLSASQTATLTATRTATQTPSPQNSVTQSATLTPSSSFSRSATASATQTSNFSSTATATFSPSQTTSATASPTPSVGQSATTSATPSVAQIATASPTLAATAEAALNSGDAALEVLALLPYPNPNPQHWALHLGAAADAVTLRIYSVAGTCVSVQRSGPARRGWSQLPLDKAWAASAANGVYYAHAVAEQGGRQSVPSARVKLLWLR